MYRDNRSSSVDPEEYTNEYYRSNCGGYEEFNQNKGLVLNPRYQIAFNLSRITPGESILDIGCGRGEVVLHSSLRGVRRAWGLDYSPSAVHIASKNIKSLAETEVSNRIGIQQSNALFLPFPAETFDCAFMLDIVEHLYPDELHLALSEVYRVLRYSGRLIVHTAPSLWYYKFGYPIYRFVQQARGVSLPKDPRKRWAYSHVHVNEQDPISLDQALKKAGFKTKTQLIPFQTYNYEKNKAVRFLMRFASNAMPLKFIFCDDIYSVAVKA